MRAFQSFVPAQHRLVDAVQGALTSTGTQGAVLIVEPENATPARLGEGAGRQVLVIAPDASGALRVMGRNGRIVPCATCGGMAGDPYGYTRIASGGFTVAVGGGSRERWSADYTFAYEPAAKRFVVDTVTRRVVDTLTDERSETSADAQDLGVITFEDFDPAQLGDEPTLEAAN